MDPGFHSLLYTEPRLYDVVFPDDLVGPMCRGGVPAVPAGPTPLGARRRLRHGTPPGDAGGEHPRLLGGTSRARPNDVGGIAGCKLYAFARRR